MPEKVTFFNSLGQKLVGFLHRCPSSEKPLGPTVILCHGMMSCKEGRKQVEFSEALEKNGFSVLRFDFSFCGESGGNFEEITFTQEVDDLACAVRWVRDKGGGPLGLVGSSMGGAVALLYGRKDPSIRAIVTMATVGFPNRLADRMETLKMKMEEWKEEGHQFGAEGQVGETFFLDARGQDIIGAISNLAAPVLILHGALDEVVPVEEARALGENASEPKKFKILPEADHRFIRKEDLEETLNETLQWFQTYLTPKGEG